MVRLLACTAQRMTSKLLFACWIFLAEKIINHRFQVDNYKGESGIGYEMIIRRDLMVHIGLMTNFKC